MNTAKKLTLAERIKEAANTPLAGQQPQREPYFKPLDRQKLLKNYIKLCRQDEELSDLLLSSINDARALNKQEINHYTNITSKSVHKSDPFSKTHTTDKNSSMCNYRNVISKTDETEQYTQNGTEDQYSSIISKDFVGHSDLIRRGPPPQRNKFPPSHKVQSGSKHNPQPWNVAQALDGNSKSIHNPQPSTSFQIHQGLNRSSREHSPHSSCSSPDFNRNIHSRQANCSSKDLDRNTSSIQSPQPSCSSKTRQGLNNSNLIHNSQSSSSFQNHKDNDRGITSDNSQTSNYSQVHDFSNRSRSIIHNHGKDNTIREYSKCDTLDDTHQSVQQTSENEFNIFVNQEKDATHNLKDVSTRENILRGCKRDPKSYRSSESIALTSIMSYSNGSSRRGSEYSHKDLNINSKNVLSNSIDYISNPYVNDNLQKTPTNHHNDTSTSMTVDSHLKDFNNVNPTPDDRDEPPKICRDRHDYISTSESVESPHSDVNRDSLASEIVHNFMKGGHEIISTSEGVNNLPLDLNSSHTEAVKTLHKDGRRINYTDGIVDDITVPGNNQDQDGQDVNGATSSDPSSSERLLDICCNGDDLVICNRQQTSQCMDDNYLQVERGDCDIYGDDDVKDDDNVINSRDRDTSNFSKSIYKPEIHSSRPSSELDNLSQETSIYDLRLNRVEDLNSSGCLVHDRSTLSSGRISNSSEPFSELNSAPLCSSTPDVPLVLQCSPLGYDSSKEIANVKCASSGSPTSDVVEALKSSVAVGISDLSEASTYSTLSEGSCKHQVVPETRISFSGLSNQHIADDSSTGDADSSVGRLVNPSNDASFATMNRNGQASSLASTTSSKSRRPLESDHRNDTQLGGSDLESSSEVLPLISSIPSSLSTSPNPLLKIELPTSQFPDDRSSTSVQRKITLLDEVRSGGCEEREVESLPTISSEEYQLTNTTCKENPPPNRTKLQSSAGSKPSNNKTPSDLSTQKASTMADLNKNNPSSKTNIQAYSNYKSSLLPNTNFKKNSNSTGLAYREIKLKESESGKPNTPNLAYSEPRPTESNRGIQNTPNPPQRQDNILKLPRVKQTAMIPPRDDEASTSIFTGNGLLPIQSTHILSSGESSHLSSRKQNLQTRKNLSDRTRVQVKDTPTDVKGFRQKIKQTVYGQIRNRTLARHLQKFGEQTSAISTSKKEQTQKKDTMTSVKERKRLFKPSTCTVLNDTFLTETPGFSPKKAPFGEFPKTLDWFLKPGEVEFDERFVFEEKKQTKSKAYRLIQRQRLEKNIPSTDPFYNKSRRKKIKMGRIRTVRFRNDVVF